MSWERKETGRGLWKETGRGLLRSGGAAGERFPRGKRLVRVASPTRAVDRAPAFLPAHQDRGGGRGGGASELSAPQPPKTEPGYCPFILDLRTIVQSMEKFYMSDKIYLSLINNQIRGCGSP